MLLCRSVLGQFFLAQELSEEKGTTNFGEHAKAAGKVVEFHIFLSIFSAYPRNHTFPPAKEGKICQCLGPPIPENVLCFKVSI